MKFSKIANTVESIAEDQVRAKCYPRLHELGKELRRPEADYLRDGIYELWASVSGTHYRLLYFFHGVAEVVVSHGIIKAWLLPPKEIDCAVVRKARFEAQPERYTFEED